MKKLALFDLDGTLFDTKDINFYAYQEALAIEKFDLNYDYYTKECNGKHYTDFLSKITNNAKDEIIERIHKNKKDLYSKHLDKVRVNEKLFDIVKSLKEHYYVVIVTTASSKNSREILAFYNKIDLFDMIITPDDYVKTKPDPESFLLAMKIYNAKPEDTLIFEDSEFGIKAAKETGATVFVVNQF